MAKENWTWQDYDMTGKPTIELDDYTIRAFGREKDIEAFTSEVAHYARNSTRLLYKLVAYWGSGKSTYLYNICHNVNEELFFKDGLEETNSSTFFPHVLAFYQKKPEKRTNLLENVYNDGIPVTWDASRNRRLAGDMRKDLWVEALRKLSFILLRKAITEISKKGLAGAATGGSVLREDLFKKFSAIVGRTNEFIKKVESEHASNDQTFEECGEIMRFYMKMLMPSLETKKGNRTIVKQELFEEQFPKFLYPCNSSTFRTAYSELFSQTEINLRYFPAFERLMKVTDTSLLLVFDEVEDWSEVVKKKIDYDIHDIVIDAESPISIVLIFRTDVLENIRATRALSTFMTIHDRLDNVSLRRLTLDDIKQLTAGVLATARNGKLSTFPLTDDFIARLADMTKRAKFFNTRGYLRALISILNDSRNWSRSNPELKGDLLDEDRVQQLVSRALELEDQESRIFKKPSEVEE